MELRSRPCLGGINPPPGKFGPLVQGPSSNGVSRNFGGICHRQVFVEQTLNSLRRGRGPQQVGGQATKGTR
jgi:hypothetical protein